MQIAVSCCILYAVRFPLKSSRPAWEIFTLIMQSALFVSQRSPFLRVHFVLNLILSLYLSRRKSAMPTLHRTKPSLATSAHLPWPALLCL